MSAYFHHIGAGRLLPNKRLGRLCDDYGIISMGYYAQHLEHWMKYFPRDRFKILIYEEDLSADNKAATLRSVFSHVGVDSSFEPSDSGRRYNKRRSHFDYRLSRLPGQVQDLARKWTPRWIEFSRIWDIPIAAEELDDLSEHYRCHNERLECLLGRPLKW